DLTCASTAFTFKGLTAAVVPNPADPYDVYNVSTVWITSGADPYYNLVFGNGDITAVTLPLSYAGVLQQCDLYLNGVDRTWSTATPTQAGVVDVQSIVLHEAGHCQGLDHSYVEQVDVMYAESIIGGQKRALTSRDSQSLCTRYPSSGAVGSPCLADGGCGSNPGLKCVRPPVDGGTGLPVCTVGCPTGVNHQCAMPFVCQPSALFSPSYNGACLPPGQFVTQVGRPCTIDDDCGSTNGRCFPQNVLPSGFPWWQAGYCTQDCRAGQPTCPAGSACIDFGGVNGLWCLKECRVGSGDCRPGYTCVLGPTGSGICVSSCHNDVDCGSSATELCRVCDGTCLSRQNPSGQIGDPCLTGDQCGVGQVCAKFTNSSQGICTQGCGSACSACPVGSSCHPVGSRGELYCLRDCQPHTCPPGLQCGQLPTGRGCMPPCANDTECSVGTQCILGECIDPYENFDAGCALCPQPGDGGNKPNNGAPDAGHLPPPGSGGCGCQGGAGPVGVVGAVALLFYLLLAPRRSGRIP
ncbi:MAG: matrixin family metalloprotease, partial [Myxococcaceae bacterium]